MAIVVLRAKFKIKNIFKIVGIDFNSIAEKIISLKDTDLEVRARLVESGEINESYNPEMEEVHNRNAQILNDIIDSIGYPTIDKVGKEASAAAWLVIQHSIGQPDLMRRCKILLETAVKENKANPVNLAYLTDRIAVYEGRPQLYGTNFNWSENGELDPYPFDDLFLVNERRKSLGLNSMEEQTQIIRKQVKDENQSPPKDFGKRKLEFEEWRRKAGWIR